MSLTGLLIALLLMILTLVMVTLSTSMIYAITQVLSWCADRLFDLHAPRHFRT